MYMCMCVYACVQVKLIRLVCIHTCESKPVGACTCVLTCTCITSVCRNLHHSWYVHMHCVECAHVCSMCTHVHVHVRHTCFGVHTRVHVWRSSHLCTCVHTCVRELACLWCVHVHMCVFPCASLQVDMAMSERGAKSLGHTCSRPTVGV